jgi:hypothetical protein
MTVHEQAARSHEATRVDRRGRNRRSPLEPRGVSARLGRAMAGHPVRAHLVVALVGFAVLAALAVAAGWALQHYALPEHGFGRRDR